MTRSGIKMVVSAAFFLILGGCQSTTRPTITYYDDVTSSSVHHVLIVNRKENEAMLAEVERSLRISRHDAELIAEKQRHNDIFMGRLAMGSIFLGIAGNEYVFGHLDKLADPNWSGYYVNGDTGDCVIRKDVR